MITRRNFAAMPLLPLLHLRSSARGDVRGTRVPTRTCRQWRNPAWRASTSHLVGTIPACQNAPEVVARLHSF